MYTEEHTGVYLTPVFQYEFKPNRWFKPFKKNRWVFYSDYNLKFIFQKNANNSSISIIFWSDLAALLLRLAKCASTFKPSLILLYLHSISVVTTSVDCDWICKCSWVMDWNLRRIYPFLRLECIERLEPLVR